MSKIIDTITFFDNNFIFDFRFNILEKYVDDIEYSDKPALKSILKSLYVEALELV